MDRETAKLLTFKRDNDKCVVCGNVAQDAHHLLERRLWPCGGYFIDNLVSLCGPCHIKAETTELSVEQLREFAGIKKVVVPPHLYPDQIYDKWGNPILPNKTRMMGELFFDESVQKILKEGNVLNLFTNKVKYPRTYHLPWSLGATDDDRILEDTSYFHNKEVVVTTKLDGECTNMYNDCIHARSLDSNHHASQGWVKNFWATICSEIPPNWRICGENLYARHSIAYENLEGYFYGFSIWNEKNEALSWDSTLEWFALLNIPNVPVLYRGVWDEKHIKTLWNEKEYDSKEGYVVRLADSFPFSSFRKSVAKFVMPNHVQTSHHWKESWVKNSLA